MAIIRIDNVFVLGLREKHTKTDWEVYIDDSLDESKLLFRLHGDEIDLLEKHVLLRTIDGKYYEPSDPTYTRCRIWIGNKPSNWFDLFDRECPVVDGVTIDSLLHKAYARDKQMSGYESSPYIRDIMKVKVRE